MMNIYLLVIVIIIITLALIFVGLEKKVYEIDRENFGALQSLYSNDGIQDKHLTINSNENNFKYWGKYPWNLPTRNLNKTVFYPYLYEYHIDRYANIWPYW